MDLHLTGKTALITGASKGIGKAVAEGFAAEGVNVILAARTAKDLDAAAAGIRKRWNVGVTTHALDLSTSTGIDTLGAKCQGVDILVNNAGAIPGGGLLDLDDKTIRQAWELKLFGFVNLTRHIYGAMVARKSGVIVNVIGGAATNPRPTYVAGAMANSALDAFTVAMGKGSQAHNVRVVGVHPGLTATDRQEFLMGARAEKELGDRSRWRELIDPKTVPFGRPAEADEVADMVVFLASERASHTSGVVVSMTGGV